MRISALSRKCSWGAVGIVLLALAGPSPVARAGVATGSAIEEPLPIVRDRRVFQDPASQAAIRAIPVLENAVVSSACPLVPATLTVIAGSGPKHGSAHANPDGTFDYVPGPAFRGEDVFCFRVADACGRSAEACVAILGPTPCVERNRRTCGSLLLYPEFQDQAGMMSIFTITQACCDEIAGGTWVELVFITGEDCTERNRTIYLSACDTLTFLGATQDLGGDEGYMYAFAKSAQTGGTPIVSNRLVGNSITFDALAQLSYSMNAVAFRGIGADGSPNDEDNDGVRDLDGVQEYEEAPSKILVPRFLGQDAMRGSQSTLILIALSGGSEFSFNGGTRVLFSVFDDNESATSVGYDFFCWKRERLVTISNAFLQSSISGQNNPNDDPDEIFGAPAGNSAGWFTIDGVVARSNVETIVDPAIYAVLIERRGPVAVAQLPFELCSQPNGDLLPTNVAGDPTAGFPGGEIGDNQ